MSTFTLINNPLRFGKDTEKHPLAVTVYHLHNGLKKLRALNFHQGPSRTAFRPFYLWRGMKDMKVPADFEQTGGSERGVMSTTSNTSVAAGYASKSEKGCPLFFRIKVQSPMDKGADVSWLSAYPGENEVIYPPLSFMQPLFKQELKGIEGGFAITMTVSFPS